MSFASILMRQTLPLIKLVLHFRSFEQIRKLSKGGDASLKLAGAKLESVNANGVPCDWITPDNIKGDEVILYLHGGGFVFGWYASHKKMVAEIAKACKIRALGVDYRLAPEHPFPAPLDDCVQVYLWLVQNGTPPEKIIVMGDSAGGNLTLTTILALREKGVALPLAGVCLSPVTDFEGTGDSRKLITDPMMSRKIGNRFTEAYIGKQDKRNPLISPYYADLHGLPPLLIQVGTREMLFSDATGIAKKAEEAGVDVTLEIGQGMWHVWQLNAPFMPESNQAIASIARFVEKV